MRLRNYCFTLFTENKDDEEESHRRVVPEESTVRFAIWQLEVCATTGRRHYQGYVEFNNSMRVSAVKALLGGTVHLEKRRGSREQAIEYCRKDDTKIAGPWTIGDEDCVQPGKRTDLDNIGREILDGANLSSIVEKYPGTYIKYRRGIEALVFRSAADQCRSAFRELRVMVYYGDAGAGKTRKAIEECGADYFILDQSERVWFDGYEGQKNLIIDDFYGWIKWGTLLRILDGHPYRGEIKGGFVWALWTKVYITSNIPVDEWYPNITDERRRAALNRRITERKHFSLVMS